MSEGRRVWEAQIKLCTNYARRNPGVRFRIYGVRFPSGLWYYQAERRLKR
jgi:hypothetical protein